VGTSVDLAKLAPPFALSGCSLHWEPPPESAAVVARTSVSIPGTEQSRTVFATSDAWNDVLARERGWRTALAAAFGLLLLLVLGGGLLLVRLADIRG